MEKYEKLELSEDLNIAPLGCFNNAVMFHGCRENCITNFQDSKPLLEQANISIRNFQPFSLPSKEPWTQKSPMIILDLHKNKKSEVDSQIFKTEFLQIESKYKRHISIYTDSSKR